MIDFNHPNIDKRPDGIYIYFHDLPPILYDDPIIIPPEDVEVETQNLASPQSNNP